LKAEKLIMFFTNIKPKDEDADSEDWLARLNAINHTLPLAQFHWCTNAIWGQYSMSYADGLNTRQFIKMLRRFSSAFIEGSLTACDVEEDEPKEECQATSSQEPERQGGEKSNVVLHSRARDVAIIAPHSGHPILRLIKTIGGRIAYWVASGHLRNLKQV
jgi:hypothetical protein